MNDTDKLISLVFEKHNLEQAIYHYKALESVTSFYPCNEFEVLPRVYIKLVECLECTSQELSKFAKVFTPDELEEVRKVFYKRYKMPFNL